MTLPIIVQSAESELTTLLSKVGAQKNSEYSACGSTTEDLPCVDHHQAMSEASPLLRTVTVPTTIMSNNLVNKTRNTYAQPRVGNQAKSMEPSEDNVPAQLEFDEGKKEIRAIVNKLSELGILRLSAGGLKATEAELADTQSSYYLLPPLPAHMAKLLCSKSTHKKTDMANSVVAVEPVNHSSKENHDALAPVNAMEKGILSSLAAAGIARNEASGATLEPKSEHLTEMLQHCEESQLSTSGDNLTVTASELGVKRLASLAADQVGERILQCQAGVVNEIQCTDDESSKTFRDIKPCSTVMKMPMTASVLQQRKPPQEDQMHMNNQGEVTQIIELVNEPGVKADQEPEILGGSCKLVGIPTDVAEEGEIVEDGVLKAGETILKQELLSEDIAQSSTIKVSEDCDTNPQRPLAVGKDTLTTAIMPQMAGKSGDQSSERPMEHQKLPHYPHHALETENRYTVKQLLLPQAASGYQPCEIFKHAQQQRSGVLQTLYDSHETMSHQAAAEELWRLHLYNQRRQQFAPLTPCNHQPVAASQPQSSSGYALSARCGKTNLDCDTPEKTVADASRPTADCADTVPSDSRPLLPDPAYATHAVAHMPNLPEYWLQYQRRFLKSQQADLRDDGAAPHLQPHLSSSDRGSDSPQIKKAENLADPSPLLAGRLPLIQWPHRLLPYNNKPLFNARPHLQHRASSQSSSSQQPWPQATQHRRGTSTRIPGPHFSNTHGPQPSRGQQVHRKPLTRPPVTRPQFPRQLLQDHRGVLGYPSHLFHQALLQQMIALQAADAQTTAGCPRHWRRIKRDFTARDSAPYQPQVWQQHGGQSRRSQSTSVYPYRSQNNNSGWNHTPHDHEEKDQRVPANSHSNESAHQQFEKDQQINQQPAAAVASQPSMHHTLRFPQNMKWQRVPNDRNTLQTLVKNPGQIPDEENLQSKHIAAACNCEHCRAKSTISLEASPREVLTVA